MNDSVEPLAFQLLGRVAGDCLDGPAVVQRDAMLVEQRDRFLTLIDECAEARFALCETAPQPRAFACIAKRSAKQRRVGRALDEIVLRAGVHRRNRQPIIVARSEHDDRRVAGCAAGGRMSRVRASGRPRSRRTASRCTGREPREGIRRLRTRSSETGSPTRPPALAVASSRKHHRLQPAEREGAGQAWTGTNRGWSVFYRQSPAGQRNHFRLPRAARAQPQDSSRSKSLLSVSSICSHERRQRLALFELAQAAGDVDVQIPGLSGEAVVRCHRLEYL